MRRMLIAPKPGGADRNLLETNLTCIDKENYLCYTLTRSNHFGIFRDFPTFLQTTALVVYI